MVSMHQQKLDLCPFIDHDQPGCRSHFSVVHLAQAFDACVGGFQSCPQYYKLMKDHPTRLIAITAHGRNLQSTGS